jgi:hypothetical protein
LLIRGSVLSVYFYIKLNMPELKGRVSRE